MKEIVPILATVPYFSKICPPNIPINQFLPNAIPGFQYEFFEQGKAVFHFGERGDKFYLVLGGTAGVYVPKSQEQLEQESNDFPRRSVAFVAFDEKAYRSKFKRKEKTQVDDEVALLNAGRVDRYFNEAGLCLFKKVHVYNTFEAFGDMALTTDKPRTASIVALTDLHLLSLTKLEFRRISERQMRSMQTKFEFLEALFHGVSKHIISKILPYFKEVEFSPKQVIWNESEQSEFSLVIRSGRVLMSKYNKLANFMVVTQRYLKFCIQGELNFIGEKELISQSVREFTCEAMEELVKAYLITGEDLHYLMKMHPDIQKKILERSETKHKWLTDRQCKLSQVNDRQIHEFNQIGKPAPKPPERISLKELKQNFEETVEHDDPRNPRIRSQQIIILPSKTKLLEHKIRLHERHLRRSEELVGKKLSNFQFSETPEYTLVKSRIVNKFNQERKMQEEASDYPKRSMSNHTILPQSIMKSYSHSLKKGRRSQDYTSVTGAPIEGFLSHCDTRRSSAIKPPVSERAHAQSFKLDSLFLTETLQLNSSNQKTVSPIHQTQKQLSTQYLKKRMGNSSVDLKKKLLSLRLNADDPINVDPMQDSLIFGSQLKNL